MSQNPAPGKDLLQEHQVLETCAQAPNLTIASTGYTPWAEVAPQADKVFHILVQDERSLRNLKVNPRVAFVLNAPSAQMGQENHQQNLRGNGIAHTLSQEELASLGLRTPEKGQWFRLDVYRFQIPGSVVLERHKEGWVSMGDTVPPPWWLMPRKAQALFWWRAMRGISVPLSFYPLLVGLLCGVLAGGTYWLSGLAMLVGSVCAHMAVNLISDYYDYKRGVDTPDALSSHVSALVDEQIDPDHALLGALVLLLITSVCGGILIVSFGWPILAIGLGGILGGYSYTGGLIAYKYKGLGEVFIFLLMGPLLTLAAYFAQTGTVDFLPLWLSLGFGLLVSAVTLSNNLRDMVYDKRSAFQTLPMRVGIATAKRIYTMQTLVPYVLILLLVLFDISYWPLLLTLVSLPKAMSAMSAMSGTKNSPEDFHRNAARYKYPLNSILQQSSYSFWLVLGLVLVLFLS